MIKINQIKLPVTHSDEALKKKIIKMMIRANIRLIKKRKITKKISLITKKIITIKTTPLREI